MRSLLLVVACAGVAWAQDGKAIYQAHCGGCHDAAQGRTPPVSSLRAMTAPAILAALMDGVMKVQAASLTTAEKTVVAEYLGTAKTAEVKANVCAAANLPAWSPSLTNGWSSWGVDLTNSRFQAAQAAGLTAAQVPKLKLKWAFNLGADAEPRSQPAAVDGVVYVGSDKLYALDARTGCTLWGFGAGAPVRSGVSVGDAAVFFGDQRGIVYAVSRQDGKLLWKAHGDTYFAAMITATPVLYKGVLYVGVSSFEEVMAGSPKYPCCGFRGSVVALNAATGAQIWKTYTIDVSPEPVTGTTFRGPSGAGVWSSPTIDEKLQRLYISTGDNYSPPSTGTSDSVMAMDLATGKLLWTQQVTEGDIYNVGCDPLVHGACPETHGNDFDFGQPPILVALGQSKRALVIGQKSGLTYGFDPDADGKPLWKTRVGEGGTLGGIQWGSAANEGHFFVAVSDVQLTGVPDKNEKAGYRIVPDPTKGGGLFALNAATGKIEWTVKPAACGDRTPCSPAQSAAVSGMPGVVFSGSVDGHVRGYSTQTGAVIWDADTEREYTTVSGAKAQGGSLDVAGPVIAAGAVYVMSGYGRYGGKAGNVLLAYSVDGK